MVSRSSCLTIKLHELKSHKVMLICNMSIEICKFMKTFLQLEYDLCSKIGVCCDFVLWSHITLLNYKDPHFDFGIINQIDQDSIKLKPTRTLKLYSSLTDAFISSWKSWLFQSCFHLELGLYFRFFKTLIEIRGMKEKPNFDFQKFMLSFF